MALITTHDILGNTKLIKECTLDDIGGHFQLISQWIPKTEWMEFQGRMMQCVAEGRAYCMTTSNTFLYYKEESLNQGHGVALYGKESPVDILALFAGIFKYIDTDMFIMKFKPHRGKEFVAEYKSIITAVSARRYGQCPDKHVSVRIDEIKNKLEAIYDTRGYE